MCHPDDVLLCPCIRSTDDIMRFCDAPIFIHCPTAGVKLSAGSSPRGDTISASPRGGRSPRANAVSPAAVQPPAKSPRSKLSLTPSKGGALLGVNRVQDKPLGDEWIPLKETDLAPLIDLAMEKLVVNQDSTISLEEARVALASEGFFEAQSDGSRGTQSSATSDGRKLINGGAAFGLSSQRLGALAAEALSTRASRNTRRLSSASSFTDSRRTSGETLQGNESLRPPGMHRAASNATSSMDNVNPVAADFANRLTGDRKRISLLPVSHRVHAKRASRRMSQKAAVIEQQKQARKVYWKFRPLFSEALLDTASLEA